MPATEPRMNSKDVARLGTELYARVVKPHLRPEDDGKFVALDVLTGEYEMDADDNTAIDRLLARVPGAEGWLECVGQPAAYRL